jgi:hypothetical protein
MRPAGGSRDLLNQTRGLSMYEARRIRSLLLTAVAAGVLIALSVSAIAQADFAITGFGGSIERDGAFSRQAGAHVDLTTRLEFPPYTGEASDENVRTTDVKLPAGIVADPTAGPTCSREDLANAGVIVDKCPADARVGSATIISGPGRNSTLVEGIYNLARPADAPALFGFNVLSVVVIVTPRVVPDASVPGGYRVVAHVGPIPQALGIEVSELEFSRKTATAMARPFMTNSTNCLPTPASTEGTVSSWQHPDAFTGASFSSDFDGIPFVNEGCERVPFDPSVEVQPTSDSAGGPTGLNVDLEVPQNGAVDGIATAHVRKVEMTLPLGMGISAAAAAGQGACSPAEIGLGSNAAPACPESANLGTVTVKSPVLDEELHGDVILAQQKDNPFGSLLALYLTVKGPGFYLKLPGRIDVDPGTGQVTTVFDNAPQLPFEELELSLRTGATAPLQAPPACGTYNAHTKITSWASSVPVSLDSPITIDEGCAVGGFSPGLRAGTTNPVGGRFSPFNLQITRSDGEQNISRIEATLPEGLLAKLAGVPLCSDAGASTGDCPAASQVGTATVGVGPGSSPIYVPQPGKAPTGVYLAGPYKGAPYSLVVKVPGQAGPFDLGTVTVRNALNVDPTTTRVTASSDPLPQILEGIPLAYRDVRVEVNRPGFMVNPTSCEPMKVDSTIVSAVGATANPSARFQVAGCDGLAFEPRLALKLQGSTRRGGYPKLGATLRMPRGGANVTKAAVTLPHSEFLAQEHIQTICTRVQYAAQSCPKGSIYGRAKAYSPLLDKPLEGPVYLRSSNHPLPDLVASLDGQIHVDLAGRIDSHNRGIRTTFWAVPDAPVSSFVLQMRGGAKSLLVNSTGLCAKPHRAEATFQAHNGKARALRPAVQAHCPQP